MVSNKLESKLSFKYLKDFEVECTEIQNVMMPIIHQYTIDLQKMMEINALRVLPMSKLKAARRLINSVIKERESQEAYEQNHSMPKLQKH